MYVLPISSKSLVGKDPILLYDPIPLYTHVYTQKWNYTALLYYSIVHFKYVIDVLNMYMYILGMYLYCILNTHWCQMHTQTVFQLGGGLVPLASFQTVLYSQVGLSGNPSWCQDKWLHGWSWWSCWTSTRRPTPARRYSMSLVSSSFYMNTPQTTSVTNVFTIVA
jgi:hypothetical protein